MTKADPFSATAREYARYRPHYPDALFDFLADAAPQKRVAWDAGTGSGQAARALARHFRSVVATDLSTRQLRAATPHERVVYVGARAEAAPLADRCVDLVTAAQAVHWFDVDRFYREVRRVAAPGAVIGVWSYYLAIISPGVDEVVRRLAHDLLGAWWPPERRIVEARYETLPFPFDPFPSPDFEMKVLWTLEHLIGYLGTWSALGRYLATHSDDPLMMIAGDLERAWGDPASPRWVRWPMRLLAGLCR